MRRVLACLPTLILGLVAATPPAGEPVAILQGGDLRQFDLVGLAADSIAIESGEVRLTGKPLGYFATRSVYQDYVLTFEYKYDRPADLKADADFRGNTGVLIHRAGPQKVWPNCVQIQLAQFDPGAIFAMNDSKAQATSDPRAQKSAVKPVGEWNKIQVTSRAGTITCLLNGSEVARAEKAEPARGPIAWQSEGYPVRFREIRIAPLP